MEGFATLVASGNVDPKRSVPARSVSIHVFPFADGVIFPKEIASEVRFAVVDPLACQSVELNSRKVEPENTLYTVPEFMVIALTLFCVIDPADDITTINIVV